jgi:hypothetical protein
MNLFHIFPSLIVFSTYFRNLYEFLEFLKDNEKQKIPAHSIGPAFGTRLRPVGPTSSWNRLSAPMLWHTMHGGFQPGEVGQPP